MITCKECGKEFVRVSPSHLWAKHKMTTKDYMKKYPGVRTCPANGSLNKIFADFPKKTK